MLLHCNAKCHTSVTGLLDPDTNEVVCGDCGEIISNVSEYAKNSMKISGDVLRSKNRKAFVFNCETCDTHVQAAFDQSKLVGKNCPNERKGCKINVTEHMKKAIEETGNYLSRIEEHDNSAS